MTPSFKFKKNLLITLIALAAVLIGANIILKNLSSASAGKEFFHDEKEISLRFVNILGEFGIEPGFIKEKKSVDKQTHDEFVSFRIQVPRDLTIPEILLEIYRSFGKDSLIINSVEKIKGGRSVLTLKSGRQLIIEAEFEYSKSYYRNMGSMVFIIYDMSPTGTSTISLIESPAKLNFLIRPGTEYLQSIDMITDNLQQFSVLVDDDISEQKYQLSPGFSKERIINVVKTLVTDFEKAVFFVIDDKSNFYRSANYEILNNELSKRNIKLYKISDFVSLNYDENLDSIFTGKLNALGKGESVIFLLSEKTYIALRPGITKFEMKGFRVITSSLVL